MPKFSLHAMVPIVQVSSNFFLFVTASKTSISITVKAFCKIIAKCCFFFPAFFFFLFAWKESFQTLKANLCFSPLKLTWTNGLLAVYFDRPKDYKKCCMFWLWKYMEKVKLHFAFSFLPWFHTADQTNNYSRGITGTKHRTVPLVVHIPCGCWHV